MGPLKPNREPSSAFTRLELAAILAVVSMFALLVVSVEGTPRSRTFLMTDLNNHRRLLQATTSFANDNGGLLPNPGWTGTQSNWLSGANFPVPTGNGNFSIYKYYYRLQLTSLTNGQLFPYVRDPRIYMCPADSPDDSLFYQRYQRTILVCSYVWNGAVDGYGTIPQSYALARFLPDSILEWEADESQPFYFSVDFSQYPDEGISGRHSPETMVGEFGGSVTPIGIKSWYGNTLAGTFGARGAGVNPLPNRVWCNPGTVNGLP